MEKTRDPPIFFGQIRVKLIPWIPPRPASDYGKLDEMAREKSKAVLLQLGGFLFVGCVDSFGKSTPKVEFSSAHQKYSKQKWDLVNHEQIGV
jgi:hypothetical protein